MRRGKESSRTDAYVQCGCFFAKMYKYVFIWDTGDGEGELSGTLERTIPAGVPRRVLLMKRQIFYAAIFRKKSVMVISSS